MTRQLHPEAPAILTRLQQEGISSFYHFTSVENLLSICQMEALCSKGMLEEAQKLPEMTGGNLLSHELDQHWGNWDKVCLSFTPYTPMAYQRKIKQHLCYLLISPEVATWRGVLFTDTNAAKNDHSQRGGIAGLNLVDFASIKSIPFGVPNWKRGVQAEVLVPDKISLEYINSIAFVSSASMKYAQQFCNSLIHPAFVVKPYLFTDSPHAPQTAIQFPYIEDLFLVGTNFDRSKSSNVVYLTSVERYKYSRSGDQYTYIVAIVKALSESPIILSLYKNKDDIMVQVIQSRFSATSENSSFIKKLRIEALSPGIYYLTCEINNVLWTSTRFEVTL